MTTQTTTIEFSRELGRQICSVHGAETVERSNSAGAHCWTCDGFTPRECAHGLFDIPAMSTFGRGEHSWSGRNDCAECAAARAARVATAPVAVAAVPARPAARVMLGQCIDCGERAVYETVGRYNEMICSRCR